MKKVLNYNFSFLIISAWLFLANACYLIPGFPSLIITLCFFLFIPGFLLMKLLRLPGLGKWYTLTLSLGLSILILMALGLILNGLSIFGLQSPLSTFNIFTILDAATLILLVSSRKAIPVVTRSSVIKLSAEEKAGAGIGILLPVFAIFGAIRLNNGGSDILSLILFALIPLVFLWLVARPSLKRVYPFILFCIAVAILFSVSLRGWFVTGSDVQREFYVFQLTLAHQRWNMRLFQDPYNACVSITILPTIFAKITHISPAYIYKVLYQLIFGVCVTSVYLLAEKIRGNSTVALFSTFLFMLFPLFMTDITMVNRQEIAFVFFFGLMLVNFTKSFTRKQQTILTILLLIGVVLSHYSSGYVALALILAGKLVYSFYNRYLYSGEGRLGGNSKAILSLPIIAVALLVTFLWNTQITNTSKGLTSTLAGTFENMFDQSGAQGLTFNPLNQNTQSPQTLLDSYGKESQNSGDSDLVYVGETQLPLTKLGHWFSSHNLDVASLNEILKLLSAAIVQLFLVVGLVVTYIKVRRKSSHTEVYLFCLCVSAACLLLAQAVLPKLADYYGISRLLQQLLIILVLPITTGLFTFFTIKKQVKYAGAAIFLGLLFLDLSGFIPQILGGYPATLSLNNSGIYYQTYYVHYGEIDSAAWLLKVDTQKTPVEMDDYAKLRFLNSIYTGQMIIKPVTAIIQGDYIYNDVGNTTTNTYQAETGVGKVGYQLADSIPDQKNLVYTNGESSIYK